MIPPTVQDGVAPSQTTSPAKLPAPEQPLPTGLADVGHEGIQHAKSRVALLRMSCHVVLSLMRVVSVGTI